MIAFKRIMKCGLATVLVTLASPDHQSKGSSTMADASIAPVLIQAKVAQYLNKGRNLLHIYACTKCGNGYMATSTMVANGKLTCKDCSMKALAIKRRKHGHRSRILHGAAGSGQWKAHHSMLGRCYDHRCNGYQNYGGRGIKVCDEWQTFEGFIQWEKFKDWKPGLQLDRIDVNGNYEPSNCRWVTLRENSQARRSSVLNPDLVRAIRMLVWSGLPHKETALIMGIRQQMVNEIMRLKTWSNV